MPEEDRFQAIIWTSAKAAVLTADGIAPRQQITRTLEDIYTTIAITLQREDITRVRPEERTQVVCQALTRQRTLLIIDNLETIDDERVNAFLRELPAPTKCIVTTRHRIDVAFPIRLVEMERDAALALIAQECEKRLIELSSEAADLLYRRTGGVPLAIVWSIAQMAYGQAVDNVLHRLGQETSDIARYCFEGAMDSIRNTAAHSLIMALALFSTGTSREILGGVTALSVLDRDEGLVVLERLSLVTKHEDRFRMLPLTKSYARSEVVKHAGFEDKVRLRSVDCYLQLLTNRQDKPSRDRLCNHERENILALLDWCFAAGHELSAVSLIREFGGFLWAAGYWSDAERSLTLCLAFCEQQDMDRFVAYFSGRLGRLYYAQGKYNEAEQHLRQGYGICLATGDDDHLAYQASYLGLVLLGRGDLKDARRVLEQGLEAARRAESAKGVARIQNVLAQVDIQEKLYADAEARLEEARKLREIGDKPSTGLAWTYEALGRLRLEQGRADEAVLMFEKSLQARREVGCIRHCSPHKTITGSGLCSTPQIQRSLLHTPPSVTGIQGFTYE